MGKKVVNKGDCIHIRLNIELKKKLLEYCQQNDTTITKLVTSLLEKELNNESTK